MVCGIAVLGIACDQNPQVSSASSGLAPKQSFSSQELARGKAVYVKYCAQCHGETAQGAPQWRKAGSDGKYPPPPLNGSGHAWHHSRAVLRNVIINGTKPNGNMPAWQGRLDNEEVDAVISYFQSLWPEPVYAAWYEMQQNSAK